MLNWIAAFLKYIGGNAIWDGIKETWKLLSVTAICGLIVGLIKGLPFGWLVLLVASASSLTYLAHPALRKLLAKLYRAKGAAQNSPPQNRIEQIPGKRAKEYLTVSPPFVGETNAELERKKKTRENLARAMASIRARRKHIE